MVDYTRDSNSRIERRSLALNSVRKNQKKEIRYKNRFTTKDEASFNKNGANPKT
jgi:hypothetical protein